MCIRFEHVTFTYRSVLTSPNPALVDVSFAIQSGELVALVGATGSGKSTLIQHLNGLLQPDSGCVQINGLNTANNSNLVSVRRRVGLVFQFPERQLFEETVYDDIAFGPRNQGLDPDAVDQRVRNAFDWVDLDGEVFGQRSPFLISGGEKRRVAIAGILATDPQVLVFDEPTVGLDWRGAMKVVDVIRRYHSMGRTVVFVSHDMDLVASLAERIMVLNAGNLIFDGAKKALFQDEQVLNHAGLVFPHISLWMQRLQNRGFPIRSDVYTIDEAKKEVDSVFC